MTLQLLVEYCYKTRVLTFVRYSMVLKKLYFSSSVLRYDSLTLEDVNTMYLLHELQDVKIVNLMDSLLHLKSVDSRTSILQYLESDLQSAQK